MVGLQRSRLIKAFMAMLSVALLSTLGFHWLGGGRWELADCLYFTLITITTVGYSESLPGFHEVTYAREFTIVVLLSGMGTVLYFVSAFAAHVIEGDLTRALRKNRMSKQISKLKDHIIVCGAGSTGEQVIAELLTAQIPTVVIEADADRLAHVQSEFGDKAVKYLLGDATDDEILETAHVDNARGLVAALANDKDNLYLVVTARQCNPTARIVARGSSLGILEKLKKAGANSVVSPNYIGGLRMVSELIRPQVVQFLDKMLRDPHSDTRIEEVTVGKGSALIGKKLRDTQIREETDVLVVAVKRDDGTYHFNPSADFEITAGAILVVLGHLPKVNALRAKVA